MAFYEFTSLFASTAWGPWLVILLVGSGMYFAFVSNFAPYKKISTGLKLIFEKDSDKEGSISKYQALTAALSGTIGLGNIAGVALAISIAGPGAVLWMWLTACVGIATKFFTCSLSVLYREKDRDGTILSGPMYVIKNGLGRNWLFLAYFFAFFGMIGGLPAVQSNQIVQIIRELSFPEIVSQDMLVFNLSMGVIITLVTGLVVIGGLKRIAQASAWLVPFMGGLYIFAALIILVLNFNEVPGVIWLIITDAFSGKAVVGGTLMGVILYGIQRGAFSNEAGIGTESLIHGTARTNNPIKQGLVAMVGPIFDTLLVCTATAVVFICVLSFGISTMFTYSYYGAMCARFLFGKIGQKIYSYIFIATILFFASISLESAINIIDGSFAMMAIPTLISSILLAPKIVELAKTYFAEKSL